MWVAARKRGNAVWIREHACGIRWRIFSRKLARFARSLWRNRWRVFTDICIGARRTVPWDEPAAPVVSDTKAWDDYNEEFEEEPDDYQEDDIHQPDTIEYWGDHVHKDLMDANDG